MRRRYARSALAPAVACARPGWLPAPLDCAGRRRSTCRSSSRPPRDPTGKRAAGARRGPRTSEPTYTVSPPSERGVVAASPAPRRGGQTGGPGGPPVSRLPSRAGHDARRPPRLAGAASSFSRSASTTNAINDTSFATQCSFIARCSRRGMRVASWTQASFCSVMFSSSLLRALASEAGGRWLSHGREDVVGWWGGMSVSGIEMCRSGVSTAGLAERASPSAGFVPGETHEFSDSYDLSAGGERDRHPASRMQYPWKNRDLRRPGSLGDMCSKETEVETYRTDGVLLARATRRTASAGELVARERGCYDPLHEDLRLLRAEPTRAADVPPREGHRDPQGSGRPARDGESPPAVHRSEPGRAAPVARDGRRTRDRRDGRHLRVPGGTASVAGAAGIDAGGPGGDALLAATCRAAHHRAPLQRLPLRRGNRALPPAPPRAAGSCRRPQGNRARQSRLARRLARGEDVDRRRPLHHRRHHPLLRARLRPWRRPAVRPRPQKRRRLVRARRGPPERRGQLAPDGGHDRLGGLSYASFGTSAAPYSSSLRYSVLRVTPRMCDADVLLPPTASRTRRT